MYIKFIILNFLKIELNKKFFSIKILNDPDSVANIRAWIPLVNNPNNISGIGMTSGTNETKYNKFLNNFRNFKTKNN